VKKTGQDFKLPYYGWYERKKIHSYVAELNDPTIFTKSIGEWNQRRLYLCKKEAKLTIDIDGDDI
jgi:predicted RNA-binding protein Jag